MGLSCCLDRKLTDLLQMMHEQFNFTASTVHFITAGMGGRRREIRKIIYIHICMCVCDYIYKIDYYTTNFY